MHESPDTLSIGAVAIPHGSFVSSPERAIVECAERLDLAGGIETVVDAITSGESFDIQQLKSLAKELEAGPAIRRIGSVAAALHLEDLASGLEPLKPATTNYVDLDPTSTGSVTLGQEEEIRDREWGVTWRESPEDLANVALQ